MKTGFFIGRFQPLHNTHFQIIYDIAKKVDYLIIGIGSSNKSHTFDNPFTLKERIDMLNESLKIKNYNLKPIPDLDDYQRWGKHLIDIVGEFDIAFTGNRLVKELLEKEGIEVQLLKSNSYISATSIRDMISKNQDWEKYVPKEVVRIIKKVDGVERVKNLVNIYKNPVPVVDVIIHYRGGIVLIERKHQPFGWAIPGGHVEYGESLEEAAVREAKEETGLDIELIRQFYTYSDPKRDPRSHKISTVYIAKAEGKPKAGSDAKKVKVFTKGNLPKLVFDHDKILEDYFKEK